MKSFKLFLISFLMALTPYLAKAQGININIDSIVGLKAKEMQKYLKDFDQDKLQYFINALNPNKFKIVVNKLDDNELLRKFIFQLDTELSTANNTIDNFLNIQDISIFKNFILFKDEDIPLRSRNYYSLIMEIHELDSLLVTIEDEIFNSIKSSGIIIQKNASPAIINSLIKGYGCLDDVKKKLEDALHKINKIADIEQVIKVGLYPDQNDYRKKIANRCIELSEICSNE